jgi:hypothetical protein
MKKEPIDIDTSKNAQLNKEEPGLPVNIPFSIVRWFAYAICFSFLLIPFVNERWQMLCGGLILGWFASQLNALIHKK